MAVQQRHHADHKAALLCVLYTETVSFGFWVADENVFPIGKEEELDNK